MLSKYIFAIQKFLVSKILYLYFFKKLKIFVQQEQIDI